VEQSGTHRHKEIDQDLRRKGRGREVAVVGEWFACVRRELAGVQVGHDPHCHLPLNVAEISQEMKRIQL